jgi:hypothetical protein
MVHRCMIKSVVVWLHILEVSEIIVYQVLCLYDFQIKSYHW